MRAAASCKVNGRDEVLWSNYSTHAQCACKKLEEEVGVAGEDASPASSTGVEVGVTERSSLTSRQKSMIVLVVVSLLTLLLAFIMGQYAT